MIASLLAALALQTAPGVINYDMPRWTFLTNSADRQQAYFVMPARISTQLWVRTEMQVANDYGTRSMRALYEFDCVNGRSRALSITVFDGNNLTGTNRTLLATPGEWDYDAPGTIGYSQSVVVCGES